MSSDTSTATAPFSAEQKEAIFDSALETKSIRSIQFTTKTIKSNTEPELVYLPPSKRMYYYDYEIDETEKEAAQQFFTSPEFLKLSAQISKKTR
jgi:hypothetical protein